MCFPVDVSLYPYEVRWMPLLLFVRDEGYMPPIASSSIIRYLNVFRATLRPTSGTKQLLDKLQLTVDEIVNCTGMDAIRENLPLSVTNNEVFTPGNSYSGDTSETGLEPMCATECGLIWLGFRSERFWDRLSYLLTTADGKKHLDHECGLNLRNSKKLLIEFEIEYALNVPTGAAAAVAAQTVCLSSPFWARRVRLGVQLNLLSSKHAPLLLYHPQILFRDEPFEEEHDAENWSNPEELDARFGDVESKAFFYCTLRARMPQSLVPRPVRFTGPQYRVELELLSKWRGHLGSAYKTEPARMNTPWTVLTENFHRMREGVTGSAPPVSSPIFFRSESVMSSSSLVTEAFNSIEQFDEPVKEDLSIYHCVALPLNALSDVALQTRPIDLINSTHLRTDEIGLPIPTNKAWLIHTIESNIEILWKSRLHGRPMTASDMRGLMNADNQAGRINTILPDPRFYRFGRFILSAHIPEPIPLDKPAASPDVIIPKSPAPPKSWYGNSFSTTGSIAGLLWCHNIRLDVSLSEFSASNRVKTANSILSVGKLTPQGRLCIRCRDDGNSGMQCKSIFGRRVSQPLISRQSNPTVNKNARLNALSEEPDQAEVEIMNVLRRASVPELSTPQYLRSLNGDVLQSAQRMCTLPMEPIAIQIKGWVHYHPLHGVRIHDPGSHLKKIHMEPQQSSIIFFRPGRFWICGLMGLVPETLPLPSVNATDLAAFNLPSPANVETIRFSPAGITIHVLDHVRPTTSS
ncbi:unnamed protein product [Echinostoma caproni]|uniref:Arrestin_N domain-containing protein n=1 Tax=Echinostoma caproni TaxID=27848 RepID=A0A183A8U1_9TREM|nr:unnamed protein product [Echinostoma caproni]